MSELKPYTEDELSEQQRLYDEVFTEIWESEGQYCRAGGGQYEKSFAWWAFKHQQSKVDELTKQIIEQGQRFNEQSQRVRDLEYKNHELQKRVDAVKQLIADYKDPSITSDKSFQHGLLLVAYELEQALKCGVE